MMQDFNQNWKFKLEDLPYGHSVALDDGDFRTVRIPHDYSIEQPYSQELGDGCTGYLLGGVVWYRKHFQVEQIEPTGQKVFLYFDGMYNRANIYLNEKFLAFHPYGYAPLTLDITEYLQAGENLLAVRVDHSRYADSRWYTGSGLYRKVELHVFAKTYLPLFATQVETLHAETEQVTVCCNTTLRSEDAGKRVQLQAQCFAPDGACVATVCTEVIAQAAQLVAQSFVLEHPARWDIGKGNQYTVVVSLLDAESGHVLQTQETKFGVRSFDFDADKGFFLNGVSRKIKGVCLHHEAGLVGAAVPLDVWRRRLTRLQACGVNAIRTAHNPASRDFIALCDEMGLLVQEEFYDEWDNPKDKRYNGKESRVDYITRGHHEFFKDYAKQDLQSVILRDRNSPSIIQWSIGNEIEWTYPKYNMATGYFGADASGNYFWDVPPLSVEEIREKVQALPMEQYEIGTTAQKLAAYTREMDTSRPITANCILPSASYESGYTDALDIVGFSYRRVVYERCHKHYPKKPIMGTENLGQWHEWKPVLEHDYISGIFLWTGIDYIGESGNVDVWPRKALNSGLLDVAGFYKPSYYMFEALWSERPCAKMFTQTLEDSLYNLQGDTLVEKPGKEWQRRLWKWHPMNNHYNYADGQMVVVEVYSNCPELTLYQNGVAVSSQTLAEQPDHIYKWCVPYDAGVLVAKSPEDADGVQVKTELRTAKAPVKVALDADKTTLPCGTDSVCHIEATLLDEDGVPVCYTERTLTFAVTGALTLRGVDNGSPDFVGDHSAHSITTHLGKALLIVQSARDADSAADGAVSDALCGEVTVQLDGQPADSVQIIL